MSRCFGTRTRRMRPLAATAFILAPVLIVAGIGLTFGKEWGPLFIYAGAALAVVGALAVYLRDRVRQKALEAIAALRKTGVELRNRGLGLKNETELTSWLKERDAWRVRALATVLKLNKHESMAFETIGHYLDEDIIRQSYWSSEHTRQVAFLTADLRRLDEIRRRYM